MTLTLLFLQLTLLIVLFLVSNLSTVLCLISFWDVLIGDANLYLYKLLRLNYTGWARLDAYLIDIPVSKHSK